MTRRGAPRRWRSHATVVLLLAVVGGTLTACTSDEPPADPEQALVRTVEDTLAGSFSYRLAAEADREALEALGRDLGSVAARLNLFEVTGVVADEAVSVDVQAVGTRLAELRRFADDAVYLRVAAGDGPLAALATPELEGRLLGMAVQTGQPQTVVDAIGALFAGDWVGVTGAFDPAALAALPGASEPVADDDETELATPLPEVVAEYLAVTDRTEADGTTTLRVDLRVRALLQALARLGGDVDPATLEDGLDVLPETVTGDVVTRDGVVEAIVFDVAAGAREAGQDVPGALELRLELSDHGDPTVPDVPEARVTVPSADLAAGLTQLLATPPPPVGESASPAAP